jgi:hypothetical protein
MKAITLQYGEIVIAVVPEFCNGPGWSNAPIMVYIAGNQRKTLRTVYIQPQDQTAEMHALFGPGAAMHTALLRTIPTKESKCASI